MDLHLGKCFQEKKQYEIHASHKDASAPIFALTLLKEQKGSKTPKALRI